MRYTLHCRVFIFNRVHVYRWRGIPYIVRYSSVIVYIDSRIFTYFDEIPNRGLRAETKFILVCTHVVLHSSNTRMKYSMRKCFRSLCGVTDSQTWTSLFNPWRPRRNGRHFADDTFEPIFLNENIRISNKISLKFVPQVPINNIPA